MGKVLAVDVLWRRQPDRTAWMIDACERAPSLRWLHTDVVGVERFPLRELGERGIILTNGSGALAGPIAEWVVWALLTARKEALELVRASQEGRWAQPSPLASLSGSSVLLLGRGGIGGAAAELLSPFNVRLFAVGREGTPNDWHRHLPEVDTLVIALPLTPETQGIVDAGALNLLKPGAWVVNVSRGGILDEAALLDALDNDHLGGAILDVFAVEPLPSSSRLWSQEKVLVLPHVTGSSRDADRLHLELFLAQVQAYCDGAPLLNIVDLAAGY